MDSLRAKYGKDFRRSIEALTALQDLWGFQTNDCGVVVEDVREDVLAERGSVSASVSLVESSKGYWIYGVSIMTSISGMGYAPSVYGTTGYHSRESALNAAKF